MFSNKLKTLNKILNLRRTKAFRLIDDSQIEKVINYFKPTATNHKLIRIGEKNDGGYLIPDILKEIKYCFSAGVGHTNEFETDLNKYKIKSFLADYSIDKSIRNLHEFDFLKKFITSFDDEISKNINSWIFEKISKKELDKTILKLDVEGSEYEILSSLDERILQELKIIIIEFHGLEMIGDENTNKILISILRKISKYFYVVHIHPNNCCGTHYISKFKVPSVLEVTYINKKNADRKDGLCTIPNQLDSKNVQKKDDIILSEYWIK